MSDLIPAWVDGTLTPVDKREVHARGLRHKAIAVFVIAGTQLLIQRRAAGKPHGAGLWANTCCTHPLWGEDDAACAARRLHEELGITGLTLQAAGSVEYRAEVGGGMVEHEVVALFRATAGPELPWALNPAEVQAARWVDLGALEAEIAATPEVFTPWLRIYLAEHASQIFGT